MAIIRSLDYYVTLRMDERINERLTEASQEGNINSLYALIREDPFLLERIDQVPFLDTPLHTAAAAGHLKFAMEMMNLKPSFARKLNQDGFSPMHLALQNGHAEIVHRLVQIDSELIRVKGREGITPLHYVAEKGDLNLLAEFLSTCEESIQDLTIQSETALHRAVKNNMFEALQVLVGWLRRAVCKGAWPREEKLINWKDDEGNTVLHIAISRNQPQVVRLLLNPEPVSTNAKNLEGLTALDILESQTQVDNREVRELLCCAGAIRASSLPGVTAPADYLRSKISHRETLRISTTRWRTKLSNDVVSLLVVVAVLIISASYQAGLSPPGGVWQDDYNPSILNTTTTTTTTTPLSEGSQLPHRVGKSVMREKEWISFMASNTFAFGFSFFTLYSLVPSSRAASWLLLISLSSLFFSHLTALWVTAPSKVNSMSTYDIFRFLLEMLTFNVLGVVHPVLCLWKYRTSLGRRIAALLSLPL